MVRRRPLRRRRPPLRRAQPGPRRAVLQKLRQANRLMESGQYEQAYPLLRQLATGAERHDMPVRAANLTFRAARARLEMGDAQESVDLARHAIELLVAAGQAERVRGALPRMIEELEKRGYSDQAVVLRAEVAALLGGSGAAPPPLQRRTLPAQCPSCSGPVRADQVMWIDEHSAECAYCGSTIQAN